MGYGMILKVYMIGLSILAAAILINSLAGLLGIVTWYGFIASILEKGLINAAADQKIISLIFLSLVYPALLGVTGYYSARLFR